MHLSEEGSVASVVLVANQQLFPSSKREGLNFRGRAALRRRVCVTPAIVARQRSRKKIENTKAKKKKPTTRPGGVRIKGTRKSKAMGVARHVFARFSGHGNNSKGCIPPPCETFYKLFRRTYKFLEGAPFVTFLSGGQNISLRTG